MSEKKCPHCGGIVDIKEERYGPLDANKGLPGLQITPEQQKALDEAFKELERERRITPEMLFRRCGK